MQPLKDFQNGGLKNTLLYSVHYSVYIVHCTVCSVQCISYIVQCSLQCTVRIVRCTVYSVQCILCTNEERHRYSTLRLHNCQTWLRDDRGVVTPMVDNKTTRQWTRSWRDCLPVVRDNQETLFVAIQKGAEFRSIALDCTVSCLTERSVKFVCETNKLPRH